MVNYFFDSYAIVESILHNPSYKKYQQFPLVTTFLNKIEVCWWALTRYDQTLANIILKNISHTCEITDDVLLDALVFRQQHKKRDFSYADAIGYVFARKNNFLFLTGDKQFKDLPGVEFVQ